MKLKIEKIDIPNELLYLPIFFLDKINLEKESIKFGRLHFNMRIVPYHCIKYHKPTLLF